MSHLPGHIRDAFSAWVDSGRPDVATIEVDYQPREVAASRLLGKLWNCDDVMPSHLCMQLDMEPGTTYATAARRLKA